MAAAGLGLSDGFREGMAKRSITMLEMESDVRRPAAGIGRILSYPSDRSGGASKVGVCTEVLEHQVHPLSLLIGVNRLLADGARLYPTTSSVSFVSDMIRLISGRHNVEPIEHSHVLSDPPWRPHIRLYTLSELRLLLHTCGFVVEEAFYLDNGNVYLGLKGLITGLVRSLASSVPHLRSHVFLSVRKETPPTDSALDALARQIGVYGLEDDLMIDSRFTGFRAG